jgi:C1A family cysteine protease
MVDVVFDLCPSPVDERDHVFRASQAEIKQQVDLRPWDSLVESQGDLSSCAGNAMTNCYEMRVKQQYPDRFVDLSRLFVYYHSRLIENTLQEDNGVYCMRSVIKAVQKYGVCREDLWPYQEDRYDTQPNAAAYQDAKLRTITEYFAVRAQTDILAAVNQGYPLLSGIMIYEDFLTLSDNDAVVHMPDEKSVSLGGHAVVIVGYDLGRQQFLIKNSFGTDWGANGYAWVPFEYARYYMFDRWCFDINDQSMQVISETIV